MKNAIIKTYEDYNPRRYSIPWVCKVEDTKYNFNERVGLYTGQHGEAGELIVFDPVVDQIYAYGQKDYRGGNTKRNFVKWNGEDFISCNIVGK